MNELFLCIACKLPGPAVAAHVASCARLTAETMSSPTPRDKAVPRSTPSPAVFQPIPAQVAHGHPAGRVTPALILAFLALLERERGNAVRTRNARVAMLRTLLKFAGRRDVAALSVVKQAPGVSMKRFERPILGFLSLEVMLAIIGKPGATWTSRRDHFAAAYALQHRRKSVGNHRRARGRCLAGRCRLCAPAWQGPQAASNAFVAINGQGGTDLLRLNPELTPTSPRLPNRGAIR